MRHGHVNENGSSSLLLGFVAGAAAGALAGLLLAPSRGADLRRQMRESAGRARASAAEAYEQATHAVGDIVDRGREAVEAGREKYREARGTTATP